MTRAGSTVSVNTAGGAIDVGSARGMVIAESSSGPIQIGAAGGVQCETGGGAEVPHQATSYPASSIA